MISPENLRYFQEVARIGHISRAAERLGVTQPTLSYCIKKMEVDLGVELFIRSKKGVELTAAGRSFYRQCQEIQVHWDNLVRTVHDEIEKPRGLIRLGCHSSVAQYTLPKFLPDFLSTYPDITISLRHGMSRHLTEDVLSSNLDVAFSVNPLPYPDLVIREICRDTVTVWKAKTCKNNDLLILDPDLLQTQTILEKLTAKRITFKRTLESASLEVIAGLMIAGVGSAILPTRVVEAFIHNRKDINAVKGAPVFYDRICLVHKPEFRKLERGSAFIKSVQQVG